MLSEAGPADLSSMGLQARALMQELHNDWFPISYPQKFYETATAVQSVFYSECFADVNGDLAAMVVAKHVRLCACDKEDQGILPPVFSELDNRMVTYILTIGVDDKFRRKGIGQLLIANLVRVAKASLEQIHAIYLHVLSTNTSAIGFYEKLGFTRHKLLQAYYRIGDTKQDAFTYVLEINTQTELDWVACLDRCIIA